MQIVPLFIMLVFIAYSCSASEPSSLATLTGNTNTTWLPYIYNYTATKTNPILVFGFDASNTMYIALDDVSVVNIAFPSIQLLRNPSFENSSSYPVGWTQWCASQCYGGSEGEIKSSGCRTNRCFISPCVVGVEYLAQGFAATIGQIYNISFWSQRVRYNSANNNAVTFYAGII